MSVLFADSFFYLALLNRNDSAHAKAKAFVQTSRCRVMEREGISKALTAGHHFAQAGFNPLLV